MKLFRHRPAVTTDPTCTSVEKTATLLDAETTINAAIAARAILDAQPLPREVIENTIQRLRAD